MRMVQTAVVAIVMAAVGLWLFGGYDAAGVEATITSWVELGIRLIITASMLFFFLQAVSLSFDSLSAGKPKEALVLAFLGVVVLFAMPMIARMVTVNAAKELNQTLIESEPYIDTAAQNVVRVIRQRDSVLPNPATATPVATAFAPVITDFVATVTPEAATELLPVTIVATTAPPTPAATQEVTSEEPFDIRKWNPATPPPTPRSN